MCLKTSDELVLSEAVLQLATARGVNALIDAGATMAGLSNRQVATGVLKLLSKTSPLQGVVYFEPAAATWYVISRRGRSWPQSSSPIHERDAFVYFDESRCRGADMKLPACATAVLTIGPDMCKDKLMQAAGRLRKLDRGQRIFFAVPRELYLRMCPSQVGITSAHLLRWVMQNTVQATAAGVREYSSQVNLSGEELRRI